MTGRSLDGDPFQAQRLDGRVLVVTGGTHGVGAVHNIGWTATEGEHAVQTETGEPEDWLEAADAGAALGRLLRPEDIAPMVTYLLSDAAALVTGSVIDFDQTVHGPRVEHVAPARTGARA